MTTGLLLAIFGAAIAVALAGLAIGSKKEMILVDHRLTARCYLM